MTTRRIVSLAAGSLLAGVMVATPVAGAQAAVSPNRSMGPYSTLSSCQDTQAQYSTGFTSVSQSCTYYADSAFGAPGSGGYYFHYRSRTS